MANSLLVTASELCPKLLPEHILPINEWHEAVITPDKARGPFEVWGISEVVWLASLYFATPPTILATLLLWG